MGRRMVMAARGGRWAVYKLFSAFAAAQIATGKNAPKNPIF